MKSKNTGKQRQNLNINQLTVIGEPFDTLGSSELLGLISWGCTTGALSSVPETLSSSARVAPPP
jgi:hypothetical protein